MLSSADFPAMLFVSFLNTFNEILGKSKEKGDPPTWPVPSAFGIDIYYYSLCLVSTKQLFFSLRVNISVSGNMIV